MREIPTHTDTHVKDIKELRGFFWLRANGVSLAPRKRVQKRGMYVYSITIVHVVPSVGC